MTRQRERPGVGVTQGLVAAAVAVGFCYWAEAVALPLVLAVLLAFLLDPVVDLLGRAHLPRSIATALVLLSVGALVTSIGLLIWDQAREMADLSRYLEMLGTAVGEGLRRVDHYLRRFLPVAPSAGAGNVTLALAEERQLRDVLLRGVGSLYSVLWVVGFVPFLTFFMLSEKPALAEASLGLFPPWRRPEVRRALDEIDRVLRRYILGNVLVVLILILASGLFFLLIGLQNPFLTAALCGPVNLVPYLGAILAWVPPFLVGLSQWSSPGPFVTVAVVLSLLHLVALNALLPVLVGRSVRINALSVTLALLFWGWLWGGIGLVVAIPIVAGLKVVCDHVEEWRPLGRWLGA